MIHPLADMMGLANRSVPIDQTDEYCRVDRYGENG